MKIKLTTIALTFVYLNLKLISFFVNSYNRFQFKTFKIYDFSIYMCTIGEGYYMGINDR